MQQKKFTAKIINKLHCIINITKTPGNPRCFILLCFLLIWYKKTNINQEVLYIMGMDIKTELNKQECSFLINILRDPTIDICKGCPRSGVSDCDENCIADNILRKLIKQEK